MDHRQKTLGLGLLLFFIAFGSEALTLGRASGAALIGRPLDMVIPVQMDAGETAASLCFEAEVFHSDARQDASRVRVVTENSTQPNMVNVRVLSLSAVDEPVVTVYLRAGCGQKTTRRYVLLADFPSDVAPPTAPLVAAAMAIPSSVKVNPGPVAAPSASPLTGSDATDLGNTTRLPKAPVARRADNKRAQPKNLGAAAAGMAPGGVRPTERSAGQPRLKLDPLDQFSDRIANLDSFMTFETPQDALDSLQKIRTLEASVNNLLTMAVKNNASLADLQGRLQQAESDRFPAATVYALIALALASLAAAVGAFVWARKRQKLANDDWWGEVGQSPAKPTPKAESSTLNAPAVSSQQEIVKDPLSVDSHPQSWFGPNHGKRSATGVDVNLTEMTDSAFVDFMPSNARSSRYASLSNSPLVTSVPPVFVAHNFNSDAVQDIRQQADFFVSLGQTDRAVQVLKREITQGEDPSPLIYLDLLSIFHALGMKVEFQQLRESVELLFCCRVPAFALFKSETLDLESYPDVLSHIAEIWPDAGVLQRIEQCILQNPTRAGSKGFDLAAFRDLLLLHAVATSLAGPLVPSEAQVNETGSSVKMQPQPVLPVPPRQESIAFDSLDIDLSASNSRLSQPASLAEVDFPFLMPMFDPKGDKRS